MSRAGVIGAVLAVVAVVLVVVVRMSPIGHTDEATDYETFYRPVASSLSQGDGPWLDGAPAVRYPVGYPATLAVARTVTRSDRASVTMVNAVSLAVAAVALFLLARRWVSLWAAAAAGAVLIVNPLVLYAAASPSTELPFIALMLLAMLLLTGMPSRLQDLAGGLVLGVATLVRPAGALLCLVVAGILYVTRRKGSIAALVVVGAVAALVPWAAWTGAQGQFAPLGTVGPPTVAAGLAFAERNEVEAPVRGVPGPVRELGQRAQAEELSSYREIASFVGQEVRHHPVAVIELAAVKLTRSWYGTDSFRREPILLLVQVAFLALAIPGLVLLRANRDAFLWIVGLVLYFWLVTLTSVSIVRYMLPAVALLCLPAALSLEATTSKVRTRRHVPGPA